MFEQHFHFPSFVQKPHTECVETYVKIGISKCISIFILQGVGKNTLAVCHAANNRQRGGLGDRANGATMALTDNNQGQELVGNDLKITKKGRGGIYIKHQHSRKNSDESDIAAEVV